MVKADFNSSMSNECFLVCTQNGDFWPVERITTEGEARQSIEAHCDKFDESHRKDIRWFFPRREAFLLTDGQISKMRYFRVESVALKHPVGHELANILIEEGVQFND